LIVAIGDIHFPWANFACLEWIYGLIKTLQPDVIVQVGDLYEFQFLANWPKLHRKTPMREWTDARACAQRMWRDIRILAPKAQCYQLKGNHESRLIKRLMERWPESEPFVDLKTPFLFPGVVTQANENQEMILDERIVLMHGFASSPGRHAAQNGMRTIKGHSHMGYVHYSRTAMKQWELDAGYVGDPEAECFQYRSQTRLSPWTNGVGVVLDDVPMFIPFGRKGL